MAYRKKPVLPRTKEPISAILLYLYFVFKEQENFNRTERCLKLKSIEIFIILQDQSKGNLPKNTKYINSHKIYYLSNI